MMFYFVNQTVPKFLTEIKRAQLKRIQCLSIRG